MKKIYVISYTWRDVDLTIEHFYTPEKTVKRISEIISDEFGRKASPDEPPQQYINDFYDWAREENDNMCENQITLHTITSS